MEGVGQLAPSSPFFNFNKEILMSKKESEVESPLPKELPTIKKIVDCPRCKAKIEVEFEIDVEALIPMTLAETLAEAGKLVEEEHDKD